MAHHDPVLLEETLHYLAPALDAGGWMVDCTLGLGGHAEAFLERFDGARLLGLDRDPEALRLAGERLERFGDRFRAARCRFSELDEPVAALDGPLVALLADLGVSSMQLDDAERGFSFRHDAPLDMRMGTTEGPTPTAAEVVASYPEDALTQIFREYGEERHASRIARGIIEERARRPIHTTGELASLVERLKPRRHQRPRSGRRPLHPATQVFQALRIEVNRELDELAEMLQRAVNLLEQDGRLSIISYHSLEDRIVKHTLRDLATGEIEPVTGRPRAETQVLEVLTKKPIRPSDAEVAANPRARSARLRAARRT